MPRLRITLGGAVDREIDVDRELVVGRKEPADVVIADGEVSSRHASLRPDGDGVVVRDLGSTNGTRIDGGEPLEAQRDVPLARGQKVLIGPAILEIVSSQALGRDSGFAKVEKTVAVGRGDLQSVLVNVAKFKAARARLVVAAEHQRKTMPIDEMEVVVGRDAPPAQIAVQHQSVSARHAALRYEEGQFLLSDLGSSNGTFVDGVRISAPSPLGYQAAVTFGTVDCLFVRRAPEAGGAEGGADPHAEVLCRHAERLGKATAQEAREILAEHRAGDRTLGELFVERGLFTPREWSDVYRQREMLATLGAGAVGRGGGPGFAKTFGIVVGVLGLVALAVFAALRAGVFE